MKNKCNPWKPSKTLIKMGRRTKKSGDNPVGSSGWTWQRGVSDEHVLDGPLVGRRRIVDDLVVLLLGDAERLFVAAAKLHRKIIGTRFQWFRAPISVDIDHVDDRLR